MRLVIFPKDIAEITGKSANTARMIYKKILNHFGRTKDQGLTITDYCSYTKIDEDKVMNAINSKFKNR